MACTSCNESSGCNCCSDLTIPVGPPGVGITSTTLVGDNLVINYSDGSTVTLGPITGAAGTDGNRWHDGDGVPAGGLGNDGDFFLDHVTGNVYEKTAGVWAVVGNLKGPTGATGPIGPAGPTGATGSIDTSAGINTSLSTPNVIYGPAWSSISTDPSTDSNRLQLGGLNRFACTLQWTGRWAGFGDSNILLQIPGAIMSSGPENSFVVLYTRGGEFYPARVEIDTITGVNYLRIRLSNSGLTTGTANYLMKISGLTLY